MCANEARYGKNIEPDNVTLTALGLAVMSAAVPATIRVFLNVNVNGYSHEVVKVNVFKGACVVDFLFNEVDIALESLSPDA
jgi:hypothetical protein